MKRERAQSIEADCQKAPREGIRAQGARVYGFEIADYDLRARQGIWCNQAADHRLSKLKTFNHSRFEGEHGCTEGEDVEGRS